MDYLKAKAGSNLRRAIDDLHPSRHNALVLDSVYLVTPINHLGIVGSLHQKNQRKKFPRAVKKAAANNVRFPD